MVGVLTDGEDLKHEDTVGPNITPASDYYIFWYTTNTDMEVNCCLTKDSGEVHLTDSGSAFTFFSPVRAKPKSDTLAQLNSSSITFLEGHKKES